MTTVSINIFVYLAAMDDKQLAKPYQSINFLQETFPNLLPYKVVFESFI